MDPLLVFPDPAPELLPPWGVALLDPPLELVGRSSTSAVLLSSGRDCVSAYASRYWPKKNNRKKILCFVSVSPFLRVKSVASMPSVHLSSDAI